MTSAEIEAVLRGQGVMQLAGLPRDEGVEAWRPPQFAPVFFAATAFRRTVPTLREFWDDYWDLRGAEAWAAICAQWPGQEGAKRRALAGRLARAYPSLVRDAHLTCLLCEGGLPARYSLRNDRWGADVTLDLPTGPVYLHCYVDTARSREYRLAKSGRHAWRGTHLDLPLCAEEARRAGSFWLYGPAHVEKVKGIGDVNQWPSIVSCTSRRWNLSTSMICRTILSGCSGCCSP